MVKQREAVDTHLCGRYSPHVWSPSWVALGWSSTSLRSPALTGAGAFAFWGGAGPPLPSRPILGLLKHTGPSSGGLAPTRRRSPLTAPGKLLIGLASYRKAIEPRLRIGHGVNRRPSATALYVEPVPQKDGHSNRRAVESRGAGDHAQPLVATVVKRVLRVGVGRAGLSHLSWAPKCPASADRTSAVDGSRLKRSAIRLAAGDNIRRCRIRAWSNSGRPLILICTGGRFLTSGLHLG
jgi:hypothetical protein